MLAVIMVSTAVRKVLYSSTGISWTWILASACCIEALPAHQVPAIFKAGAQNKRARSRKESWHSETTQPCLLTLLATNNNLYLNVQDKKLH